STLILHQRHEHPSHAGRLFPRAVENVLASQENLAIAGERPVHFAVAHSGLVGAFEKIPVGYVEVDATGAAPGVEIADLFPLCPLRVLQAAVSGMGGGGADIAGVGAV